MLIQRLALDLKHVLLQVKHGCDSTVCMIAFEGTYSLVRGLCHGDGNAHAMVVDAMMVIV